MTLWVLLVILSASHMPAVVNSYDTEDQCRYAMSMLYGDTYGVACQSVKLKGEH